MIKCLCDCNKKRKSDNADVKLTRCHWMPFNATESTISPLIRDSMGHMSELTDARLKNVSN